MFCGECGSQTKKGALFCGKCGCPINNTEPIFEDADIKEKKSGQGKNFFELIKGNKNAVIGIGVIAVLVLAICLLWGPVKEVIAKTFYSPEKYFAHVETKSASKSSKSIASFYDSFVKNNLALTDTKKNYEVELSISEDGYKIIEGLTYVDLEWLNNIKLSGSLNTKTNGMAADVAFALGANKLLSSNVIIDFENESLYMQFPEFSDKYMATDELDGTDDMTEVLVAYGQMIKSMPDKATVEKLANRYYEIAMSKLTDVRKTKATLKAEGVSQDCTKLEATMDDEYFYEVSKAVLEEMLKDKDIKKMIQNFAATLEENDLIDEDKDEVYEEFCEGIEDALDELDEDDFYGVEMTYTIWVDSSGEVIGRCLEDDWTEIAWLMPRDGKKVGTEIYLSEKYYGEVDQYIGIVGEGQYSGNKLSGTYYFEYEDYYSLGKEELLEVAVDKFDTSALQKGNIIGNFKFSIPESYCKEYGLPRMVSNMYIGTNVNTTAKSQSYSLTLGNGDDIYGTVSVLTSCESAKKVSAPSNKNVIFIEDEDDAMEWVSTIKLDSIFKILEKANIPDDYLDLLEDLIEEIEYYY